MGFPISSEMALNIFLPFVHSIEDDKKKKKNQPTVKRVENALISVVFCQDLIS